MAKRVTVAGLLVAGAVFVAPLDADEPMRMQVSPSVSRAPADLVVRVNVPAAADNRLLQIVAESPDFYRRDVGRYGRAVYGFRETNGSLSVTGQAANTFPKRFEGHQYA